MLQLRDEEVRPLKSTEQIAKEVLKGVRRDRSELNRFIDFVKIYTIALKIAFRCDRGAAWELLRIFLREFEKIGMYRRKYDRRIEEVANGLKACSNSGPVVNRLELIIEEAGKLKQELEALHSDSVTARRKKQTA